MFQIVNPKGMTDNTTIWWKVDMSMEFINKVKSLHFNNDITHRETKKKHQPFTKFHSLLDLVQTHWNVNFLPKIW